MFNEINKFWQIFHLLLADFLENVGIMKIVSKETLIIIYNAF